MNDLPQPVVELVDLMAAEPDVVAIVLGGSRALESADAASDWDLGVYYRGAINLTALAARGDVHPPGSWGRMMNGGAWLQCEGVRVDIILRDLDVVEHWTRRAEEGEFEVDTLLGYLAGIPTYTLSAELASCRPLHGAIRVAPFPPKLSAAAVAVPPLVQPRLRADARAARQSRGGDRPAAKAILEEAHAVLCQRGEWVCNEKRLLEAAGLVSLNALFGQVPVDPDRLVQWVDRVADQLGVPTDENLPWK